MDDQTNFEFEPMQQEPAQPSYNPYPPKKEPKKKRSGNGLKITILVVVVAVIASIGGSFLTMLIADRSSQKMEHSRKAAEIEETEEDGEDYELVEYTLPEQLQSNNTGKTLTPAQVYEQTVNSVVGIQTSSTAMNIFGQEAVQASSGSGFILSEDGYVITNCHVVEDADSITVTMYSGDEYPAQLVGKDSSYDVALLKIEGENLPAVSVGDSDKLVVGEDVVAIGNPLGELTFTMTNGIISATNREINTDGNPQTVIQTNAAINSGNSGGPLFDMDGNVIGITCAKMTGTTSSGTVIEGLAFAIPINDALKVAYDLADYGYVKGEAYLGIQVRTLDSQTAAYYSLPIGPRVEVVNPDSCAEKAGIQVGDIVLKFNDTEIPSNAALLSELKHHKAGETVTLTIYRAGAEKEIQVLLDEKPSQDELDAQEAQQEQERQPQQQPSNGYSFQFPFGFDPFSAFGW